jgi:ATP adenylyltransferase
MKYMMDHEKSAECVFCRAVRQVDGTDNLVVLRGETAFVILNRYPYTSGHVMIVPFEHEPSFENLNASTRAEIMELMNAMMINLRAIYAPPAFNVGANIGEAAGAGIAAHVHLHVVPRWAGDNNFMATIGETRVLPEALPDSYRRIRRQLEKAGLVEPR